MEKVTLSPVTRISGLLSIDVFIGPSGIVNEANCLGEQFRGFELMMKGRKITDAVYFTQRICGICSMAHGYTAARLVGQIYGLELTPEAALLQQVMLGAEFLQNHIRHFYLLALPDYLDNDSLSATARQETSRFSTEQQRLLTEHYFAAMEYSAKCHEMLAIFAGKIPHQHGLVSEGVSVTPNAENRLQFLSLLRQVREFIKSFMLPDVYLLAEVYRDYLDIGSRPARFLSYGLFDPNLGEHFPAGIIDGDEFFPLKVNEIYESIFYSWYQEKGPGKIVPDPEKANAYTWVKAPRYRGLALEGGPLARKIISSRPKEHYPTGTMARLVSRAEEAVLISVWMEKWIKSLPEKGHYIIPLKKPVLPQSVWANDAPRGALLHGMSVKEDQIESYNVITPSTWNFSPKDETEKNGPVEEALIGTTITDPNNPLEIGRIVRSFDPCLTCAAHLIDQEGRQMRVKIV